MNDKTRSETAAPAAGARVDRVVGRPDPERVTWERLGGGARRVRCEICEWRGYRKTPRSRPCPACGSRVEFA